MYNNCHCSLRLSNVKMCEYLQKKPSNSVFTLTKKHFNLIFFFSQKLVDLSPTNSYMRHSQIFKL